MTYKEYKQNWLNNDKRTEQQQQKAYFKELKLSRIFCTWHSDRETDNILFFDTCCFDFCLPILFSSVLISFRRPNFFECFIIDETATQWLGLFGWLMNAFDFDVWFGMSVIGSSLILFDWCPNEISFVE